MAEVAAADPALATLMASCLAKDPAHRPTPQQLRDAAAAHPREETWQEPLHGRLLARQQGTEILERATARETDHLRTQTMRVAAPVVGLGPAGSGLAGSGLAGSGLAGSGPAAHPGAYGPALHPGPYGTPDQPGAYGTPGQVGAHGTPDHPDAYGSPEHPQPFGPPTPPTPPTTQAPAPPLMHGSPAEGAPPPPPAAGNPPRGRRKRYIAIGAGLAVCAVAVCAFLLTRSPGDDGHPSAAASKSATATSSDAPSSSASLTSPQAGGDKGRKAGGNSTSTLPTAPGTNTAHSTPTSGTTPTSNGGGTTTGGDHAPSPTATKATTPPWISQCTYYSGSALTVYGDSGNRVVQVQCMLSKRGYSVGAAGVDGDFGSDTRTAVKRFQTAKSLDVDGEVGPHTWAALRDTK
jgi:Putative peptidoglycan binding domain